MKTIIIILLGLSFWSCTTTKETTSSDNTITTEEQNRIAERDRQLAEEGIILVTVVDSKDKNNCGFLLKTSDNQLYKPQSWPRPEAKVDGKKIYIQFSPSESTQTDCTEATPIILHKIKFLQK